MSTALIELIRSEFADDPVQLLALEEDLKLAGENRCQSAFLFLLGRRGPQMANELVRKTVRAARLPGAMFSDTPGQSVSDDLCRAIDNRCRLADSVYRWPPIWNAGWFACDGLRMPLSTGPKSRISDAG